MVWKSRSAMHNSGSVPPAGPLMEEQRREAAWARPQPQHAWQRDTATQLPGAGGEGTRKARGREGARPLLPPAYAGAQLLPSNQSRLLPKRER